MKVGYIVEPNSKGQIVIPKDVRLKLGINRGDLLNLLVRGDSIYLQPIGEIIPKLSKSDAYGRILEKTQGAWAGDSWEKVKAGRRKLELQAARGRKSAW